MVNYTYNAWGVVSSSVNSSLSGDLLAAANGLLVHNPYVYKGYYYDSDTGYYYLKSRYYDPRIHRFLSADKIDYLDPKSLSSLNLYVYCGDNPVMMMDENGTSILAALIVGAIVGAIWGAVSAAESGQNIFAGALIGAVTGAIGGLVSLMSGIALIGSSFALGFVGDGASQYILEGKKIGDIDLGRAAVSGLISILTIGSGRQINQMIGDNCAKSIEIIGSLILNSPVVAVGMVYTTISNKTFENIASEDRITINNLRRSLLPKQDN